MNWTGISTDAIFYHQIQLQNPSSLAETVDQADDTSTFYAMQLVSAKLEIPPVFSDSDAREPD